MRAFGLLIFAMFAICVAIFLAGCSQNFNCRRDAYAAHSHVNAGQGALGSLAVAAVTPAPPPAPPLDEILAACK